MHAKFLFLALVLVAVWGTDPVETQLKLGVPTAPKRLSAGQSANFYFVTPDNMTQGQNYLIFDTAGSEDEAYDPDIFISTVAPFHHQSYSKVTLQRRRTAIGSAHPMDRTSAWCPRRPWPPARPFTQVRYLSQSETIAVYCLRECEFRLVVKASAEYELKEGDRATDYLRANEGRLFKFTVPDDPEIHSISVILDIATNISSVRMFTAIARDNELPSSVNTIPVQQSWFGLSARAYEGSPHQFCRNCMYKVLISAQEETGYTLYFKTSKSVTKVKGTSFQTYEVVDLGERNCYQVKLTEANTTLDVFLSTFSGDPDIYVNPLTLPASEDGFAFVSKGGRDEILSVTPEQRQKVGAPTGKYFVCIYGTYTSSYGLIISASRVTGSKIRMDSGLTRTISVKQDELMLFEYIVTRRQKGNVTFTLTSITGNADLYIRYCAVSLDSFANPTSACEITKNNLHDPTLIKSEEVTNADIVTLWYDPAQCDSETKRCSYIIGVLGREDSKFSLTVLGDRRTESPLAEGRPLLGYVGLRTSLYYTFVVSDPLTTSVKIQLTSLSGDADLFVTRGKSATDRLESEKYSNHMAFIPDSIQYDKASDGALNTSYHVIVYGHTSASFTLTYTIKRPAGTLTSIQLIDGIPMFGSINGTGDKAGVWYYFEHDSQKAEPADIELELTALAGSYRVYIGAGYMPQPNNYTWTLAEQESNLQIVPTDPKYRLKARYNILVVKANEADSVPHMFSLTCSTGKFTTSVKEGQPEVGNLTKSEIKYYKYQVINLMGSITVAVTPFAGDPDLYVSINSSNTAPTYMNSDYSAVSLGADIIRIPLSEFYRRNPICTLLSFFSSACSIYIGVRCASAGCGYTLQVGRSSDLVLKLVDGMNQRGQATGGEPQFYVFTPGETQEASAITVYSRSEKTKVYASIVGPAEQSPKMPTPEQHDLESINRANSEVVAIPPELLRPCGNQCRVFLGVYVDMGAAKPGSNTTIEFDIAATSRIRQLADGQTIVDNVGEKGYRYYRFRVPCSDCVLSVSLTPLSAGDPDLILNKGAMRLPTQTQYDFTSTSYRGDFIQITPEDPLIVNSTTKMLGTYMIGVYGFQNCTYSLTATTSASLVQTILPGATLKQSQPQGRVNYFLFTSWKKDDIEVTLTVRSGRATIRANMVANIREANVLDSLPGSESKSTWSSMRSNTVNRLAILKDDSQFKEDGTFFVGVEAQEDSVYEIMVAYANTEDFALMRMAEAYRAQVAHGGVKRYSFEVASSENINIYVSLFFGAIEGDVSTARTGEAMWRLGQDGLLIKTSDRNFRVGTYYVTIKGRNDSDFSIVVEQNTKIIWMSEGLPQRAKVSPLSASYFFYRIPKLTRLGSEARFNVYATMRTQNIVSPTMYIRYMSRHNASMPNKHNSDYALTWDKDLRQLGTSIKLDPSLGDTLGIAVAADLTDGSGPTGEFDIVAWTTGFAMIIPDNVYMNKFSQLGDMHMYELTLERAGRVYIEVVPCTGEVEFFVTQSLSSMNDRKYDLKKTALSKGKLFGSIDNVAGTYYISVRAVAFSGMAKDAGKGVQYSIKATVSSESTPENLEDFVPDSYGNINSYLDGDEVTLSWGQVSLRSVQSRKFSDVLYSVYVSEDDNANMYTICGIKYGGSKLVASDIRQQTATYSIGGHRSAKKLVFNVIAYIPAYSDTIAYNPLTLQIPRSRRGSRFYFRIFAVTTR